MQKWKSNKEGRIHLTTYPDLCLDSSEGRDGAVIIETCGESPERLIFVCFIIHEAFNYFFAAINDGSIQHHDNAQN